MNALAVIAEPALPVVFEAELELRGHRLPA